MITRFKSALDKIEAEEELINKTEDFLRATLNKKQNVKLVGATKSSLLSINRRLAIVACFVFLFVGVGSTGAYAYYKTPVSYLSLDINPSVELGINAFGKVIKVQGYNYDGEKVLEGIKMEGYDVTKAVKVFVESADNNGYIASDGSTVIAVTSETDNIDLATEIQNAAETGANQSLEENGKSAVIYKDNVPLTFNKEARELGVTPGKLNLIKKLQELDKTVTVEEYKNVSVKDIMKNIQDSKDGNNTKNSDLENNKKEEDTNNSNKENGDSKEQENINNNNKGNENNKTQENTNNNGNGNNKEQENTNSSDKENDKTNSSDNGNINNSDKGNGNKKEEDTTENKKEKIDSSNTGGNIKSSENGKKPTSK